MAQLYREKLTCDILRTIEQWPQNILFSSKLGKNNKKIIKLLLLRLRINSSNTLS